MCQKTFTPIHVRHIIDKIAYGGLFVNKYYVILDDKESLDNRIRVREEDWFKYKIGDEWKETENYD